MKFSTQLSTVQQRGEDHEWYPTTDEIIKAMIKSLRYETDDHRGTWNSRNNSRSFLDIGAGNGKVLDAVRQANLDSDRTIINKRYAIEKSLTLLNLLDPNVFILGADFWNTSLIDKDVDVIFCNPPYSDFQAWMEKILKEARAGTLIYFVVPERWQKADALRTLITSRKATDKIIGSFDFADAEDRKARAKVHLLKIEIAPESNRRHHDFDPDNAPEDPFETFFNETFHYPEETVEKPWVEQLNETKLVHRVNFIEALDLLYHARMADLHRNYAAICAINPEILKEFEIFKSGLITSLRMKMATAKKEYWERLFDGMKEITNRLTKASRNNIRELMQANTGIDFNRDNAYAVVMWVVKNANCYFDSQLIDTYEKMVEHANVDNYVSNKRVFKRDRFRYSSTQDKAESSHYRLKVGHRIVLNHCGGLEKGYCDDIRGISERATDFLCDLMTVARNLGFAVHQNEPHPHQWKDSTARTFYHTNAKGESESLFRVRAFQNSNLHMQFSPDFIHALNVQHGRLKGWLRNDDEAAAELEIPIAIARVHFVPNYRITGSMGLMNDDITPAAADPAWVQSEIFAA